MMGGEISITTAGDYWITTDTYRSDAVAGAAYRGRRVLRLIKMWLECAVEETERRGRNLPPEMQCLLANAQVTVFFALDKAGFIVWR